MIAVADSSPLNYLVLIDEVTLLPALFEFVLIPTAVLRELQNEKTPIKVRDWFANRPAWMQAHPAVAVESSSLLQLDFGEREAIQLAISLEINTVLMDDAAGRHAAESFRLRTQGTLAILEIGHRLGLTNFRDALDKLMRTNFRASRFVLESFVERNS